MPDTGAPWNIPYVAASDLVKDWPTDNQTQAEAIADAFDAASIGLGSNVVQTVKTDIFAVNSATFSAVTDLTATITPSTATAKVLVIAQLGVSMADQRSVHIRLSGGNTSGYVGDSAGSKVRSVFSLRNLSGGDLAESIIPGTLVYLDSPATTSPVTYGVEICRDSAAAGSVVVNYAGGEADSDRYGRGASSITVIEVRT